MSKFFLYARKSTESEDRQILSIDAQLNEMRQIASNLNIEIKEELIEAKSAKEPGREVFNDMMKRIYKGEADGVLCWKLDRLARNPIDGASIIWAMKQDGITIHTPSQSYSHRDENTILLYIEFGMAQKYVDDLSKNVIRGLRMKLKQGDWTAIPPLGYIKDSEKKVVPDPERFHLVRKMWDLMLSGTTSVNAIREIATNEWGLRTRKYKRMGGGPVGRTTIYKILTNPFYYGDMQHKQGVFKGNHMPMVTRKEFDEVQQILGRTDKLKSIKHNFPFAGGMIKCGLCGCSVTAEYTTNRHGTRYTYYHCSKKNKNVRCLERSIRAEDLECQFSEFHNSIKISTKFGRWVLLQIKSVDEEQKLVSIDKLFNLESILKGYRNQLSELNKMRYKGLLDDEEFLKEKAGLIQEQQILEEQIDQERNGGVQLYPLVEKVLHVAQYAHFWFKSATDQDKRLIIETIGSNPILQDKKLLIQAKVPFAFTQKVKDRNWDQFCRFEPSILGQPKSKRRLLEPSCLTWRAQVDDLRTFWEEEFDWKENFETIYNKFVEK
ncbi:MAG: recombinase family protein [Calditrichia bacterium]